jgi:DNA transposition AAA+ family ATPase
MTPTATEAQEVRQLARSFLRRTGMAPQDFARRIGYHYATLTQFLRGDYRRGPGSKEQKICAAILDFIGSAAAVDVQDDAPGKLYEIGNVKAMRQIFAQLVDHACILLAYAPPGNGKTDVARALIPEFSTRECEMRRIYCRAAITKRDLMRRIAIACGTMADQNIERTIANLRFEYAGRRVALYLDEAQHLDIECLETVRELYDELHWSLCFAGSHQLDKIFTKWAGDLEQLERRVTDKVALPPVTHDEALNIVASEIPDLSTSKAKALIERSHVEVRGGDGVRRFLSIGRLMANIRAFQNAQSAASAEDAQKVEAIA